MKLRTELAEGEPGFYQTEKTVYSDALRRKVLGRFKEITFSIAGAERAREGKGQAWDGGAEKEVIQVLWAVVRILDFISRNTEASGKFEAKE